MQIFVGYTFDRATPRWILGWPLAPEPHVFSPEVPAGSSVASGTNLTKTILSTRTILFNCCHLVLYWTLCETIIVDSSQSWWTCWPRARIHLVEDVSALACFNLGPRLTRSQSCISSKLPTNIVYSFLRSIVFHFPIIHHTQHARWPAPCQISPT